MVTLDEALKKMLDVQAAQRDQRDDVASCIAKLCAQIGQVLATEKDSRQHHDTLPAMAPVECAGLTDDHGTDRGFRLSYNGQEHVDVTYDEFGGVSFRAGELAIMDGWSLWDLKPDGALVFVRRDSTGAPQPNEKENVDAERFVIEFLLAVAVTRNRRVQRAWTLAKKSALLPV